MEDIARVAVVGCGYWGNNLVRNFAGLGTLAAVCDADPDRLAQFGREYGVRTCISLSEVHARLDTMQAVIVLAKFTAFPEEVEGGNA